MTIKVNYQKTFQRKLNLLLNTKKRAKSLFFIFLKLLSEGFLLGSDIKSTFRFPFFLALLPHMCYSYDNGYKIKESSMRNPALVEEMKTYKEEMKYLRILMLFGMVRLTRFRSARLPTRGT